MKVEALAKLNLTILNIYEYGSKVYEHKKPSDEDYIVIVQDSIPKRTEKIMGIDITIYSQKQFQDEVDAHEISCLECLFLPEENILKETVKFNFILNKTKLRESCSRKASNSFVKAKKKFEVPEDYDPYIGKKSLFHSLRILDFGIQIAQNHKIINYQESNHLWDLINSENNWKTLKEKIQPIYNKKKTEFRLACPKN